MQIERLPALVKQLRSLEQLVEQRSQDRDTMIRRREELKLLLGKVVEYDTMLSSQVTSYNHVIGEMDRINIESLNAIGEISKEIESIRKILLSRAWFENALGITDETKAIWTGLSWQARDILGAMLAKNYHWAYPMLVMPVYDRELVKACSTYSSLMYLAADNDQVLDDVVKEMGNTFANSAIRQYNIHGYNKLDFSKLPQGQFGSIISWYIFERLTLPLIDDALHAMRSLLLPGGTIVFNLNDGATPMGAVWAAEKICKSYVTRDLLEPIIKQQGYELVAWETYDSSSVMVMLRLPGTLSTYKIQPSRGLVQRY